MTKAVLDDHFLRDLLADEIGTGLRRLLRTHEPCTTNLYYVRLCKSVVSARGGQLTGAWTQAQRVALGRTLVAIGATVEIVPMETLAMRMAELGDVHRLSTLGAEAIAAAESLRAPLVVWMGDDGPAIRAAAAATKVSYRTLGHD